MTRLRRTGLAGLLIALALAAPAAAAPTVSLRAEGAAATLKPRTAVTLLDAAEPNTGCPGTSASAAIEVGTGGDWDRQPYFQTLLGETHDFTQDSDYWGLWVFRGGRYVVANGACDELLAAGEEVLAAYQQAPPPDYAPAHLPLWIEGLPAAVRPGQPFTVTVFETQCETAFCNPGEGHAVARPGATVAAGDVLATTGADGTATLALTAGGAATVRATRSPNTPSAAEPTCVTTGDDGLCGSSAPAAPADGVAAACSHDGDDGRCGTRDRTAPQAQIAGIAEGQRFAAGRAPRELSGSVTDVSALRVVKLRLTRRWHGRCEYFSGTREAFRATRCGRSFPFAIGTSAQWSYLLPRALKPGRYVLDAIAVDAAFNRDPLARGRNRIVFNVG